MARKLMVALFIFFNVLAVTLVAVPSTAHATAAQCSSGRRILGFPVWYEYLDLSSPPECDIVGPTTTPGNLDWPKAAGYVSIAVVEILLRVASLVAVGFVMYGGFRFITSQGNPDNAKAARETVLNALIGVVVAIVAASLISFIAHRLSA